MGILPAQATRRPSVMMGLGPTVSGYGGPAWEAAADLPQLRGEREAALQTSHSGGAWAPGAATVFGLVVPDGVFPAVTELRAAVTGEWEWMMRQQLPLLCRACR